MLVMNCSLKGKIKMTKNKNILEEIPKRSCKKKLIRLSERESERGREIIDCTVYVCLFCQVG